MILCVFEATGVQDVAYLISKKRKKEKTNFARVNKTLKIIDLNSIIVFIENLCKICLFVYKVCGISEYIKD